jgi:hypothetical protein
VTDVDCNIEIRINGTFTGEEPDRKYAPTECWVCGSGDTVLLQIDGGNCEDYIGRFLCRKHVQTLREYFWKMLDPAMARADSMERGR